MTIQELELALAAMREERDRLHAEKDTDSWHLGWRVAVRERDEARAQNNALSYDKTCLHDDLAALGRLLSENLASLAHLTEERNEWKRRAEDAEGRIGNATA